MDESSVADWMGRYLRAWGSNDPGDIGSLFTDDARYYTAPHREPWTGRDTIVREWLGRKDEPATWEFRWELLGISGGQAFIRGWTNYSDPELPDYSNLWVIRLEPDGRCSEFIEWWMGVE